MGCLRYGFGISVGVCGMGLAYLESYSREFLLPQATRSRRKCLSVTPTWQAVRSSTIALMLSSSGFC